MQMLETPFRNHPTVLIQNFFTLGLVTLFITLSAWKAGILVVIGLLSACAFMGVLLVFAWLRTTFYANQDEIVSEFNFISHKRKTVPYTKIASVNVVRNVFHRILGTATIQININSSVNAALPEISFCMKNDIANQVREELSAKIHGLNYSSKFESLYESSITLTNMDSILHGAIGTSSWFLISSGLSVAVAIITSGVMTGDFVNGVVITSLLIALSFIIPMVGLILRYFNFRVYRLGDTIYLQHGAIQTYKTSFKVNKINSIRIKRTFFARLINKACLEVDVVGINATKDTVPVLCILTSIENIHGLIQEIIPDFVYEDVGLAQPRTAAVPWVRRAIWVTLGTALVYAYPFWFVLMGYSDILALSDVQLLLMRAGVIGSFSFLVFVYFLAAHKGFKRYRLSIGEDMFMFETGIVDVVRTVMQYDRVQYTKVYSFPSARKRGLSRCKVYMLSSSGKSVAVSGYYPTESLDSISEEVQGRIVDGRYDYKRSMF